MAQYNYNYSNNNQSNFTNPVMTGDVQRSILEAYGWMFGGLILTALTAFAFVKTGLLLNILYSFPALVYILPIVQIGIAIGFSFSMARASAATLHMLFLLYAFTMGISLSSLFFVYTDGQLYAAFFVSAAYYACLCFIGMTTKKDMTKIGMLCMTGLIVMLISQVIFMLFRIDADTRFLSIIGLLIFTGITCWDVQRLNKTMLYAQGQPVAQKKWAIFFALELYLDFINIFLYILRLIGAGSSRKN